MKKRKRLLSVLLVLLMCAGIFPLGAFAEEAEISEEIPAEALTAEAEEKEICEELTEAGLPEEDEESEEEEEAEEAPDVWPYEGSDKVELCYPAEQGCLGGDGSGVSFLATGETSTLSYTVKYHQSEMRTILSGLNSFRTSNTWIWNEDDTQKIKVSGLSPLSYDYLLEQIAMQRAAELVVYYSHTRPNGESSYTLYNEMGYAGRSYGENIAIVSIIDDGSGATTPNDILNSWIEEDKFYEEQGHRRTILEKAYSAVGFAYAEYNGCGCYVQEFGDVLSNMADPGANNASTKVSAELLNDHVRKVSYAGADRLISLNVGSSTDVPQAQLILETDGWLSSYMDIVVTTGAVWQSDNTGIVSVSGGKVTGTGNGVTTLRTSVFGAECITAIRVGTAASKILVQYNANGGTGAPQPQLKDSGTAITLSTAVPTRKGYVFLGWAKSRLASKPDYATGSKFNENSDTMLYAVWENNGEPLNLRNTEYLFTGTNGNIVSTTAENGRAKLLLYFMYDENLSSREMLSYLQENNFANLDILAAEATMQSRANVAAFMDRYQAFNITSAYDTGYDILNSLWGYLELVGIKGDVYTPICVYIDKNNKVQMVTTGYLTQDKLYSNVMRYCGVTEGGTGLDEFYVSYNANGGEGIPAPQKKMTGGKVTVSSVKPLRNGYTFLGWTDSASSTTVKYTAGSIYSADANITLYAVWKEGIEKLNLANGSDTFTGINGSRLSAAANGKAKLIVYFASEAKNCQDLFALLKAGNFTNLDIIAPEIHGHSKAEVTQAVGDYSGLVSAAWSSGEDNYNSLLSYLEKIDRPTEINTPVCVYIDANNKFQQVSTGVLSKELLYSYLEKCCGVKPTSSDDSGIEKFVKRQYTVCLGREGKDHEIEYYIWLLQKNGSTGIDVANKFIFGDEFKIKNYCDRHYVIALYEAFMGREPKESEIENWVWRLQQGDSREKVFNEFALSSEFAAICAEAGIERGSAIEDTGKCHQGGYCTVEGCTSSEPIIAFATRLYNVCLDRAPRQDEIDAWHYNLVHGNYTATSASHYFIFSDEFMSKQYSNADFAAHLYSAMLGRSMKASEIEYWDWNLGKNGVSREDAFLEFASSDEFKVICASYNVKR